MGQECGARDYRSQHVDVLKELDLAARGLERAAKDARQSAELITRAQEAAWAKINGAQPKPE